MLAKVAKVVRPNVGKSTLFNRIIGQRLSITDDQPGVTRDRIYSKGSWLNKEFSLIDTGGIELGDAPFLTEIKAQAEIAMDEADVIIFVVDCRSGVTDDDNYIAKLLYKSKKPVILAVNKVDDQKFRDNIYEFYALGFGDPIPVSSSHGIGVGNLLDKVIESFPESKDNKDIDAIKFSLIGRPNVGKSSLTNTLLNDNRVIVSPIAGTTRDTIDTIFKVDGKNYRVGATLNSYEYNGNIISFRVDRTLTREYSMPFGMCIDFSGNKSNGNPAIQKFSLKGKDYMPFRLDGPGYGVEQVSTTVAGGVRGIMGHQGICVFNPYKSYLFYSTESAY